MKKILVVDDDDGILEALSVMLESVGYEVETSKDGEAVEKLLKAPNLPDLILLDMLLSGKDGRTLCKFLKSKDKTKSIPILMISAHPSAEKAVKACGADGFIPKPFAMDDLLGKVEKLLKHSFS